MAYKLVVFCAIFASATAGLIGAPAQLSYATHEAPAIAAVYNAVAAAPKAVHAVHAGPLVTNYSPAASVSHSYSSIAAPVAYAAPAVKTIAYAPASVAVHAPAHIAVHAPAVGSTHENVVRSFDGTVAHHSKAVDTAFSSVRKSDTRINNNVYSPAIATKSLAYAAPAVYASHAAPAVYASHAAPAVYASHAAPAVYTSHAAPAVYTSHAAPAVYTSHAAPAVYTSHAAPAIYSAHGAPAVVAAPATSAYATKAISYSPAASVTHVSFEGYGTNYGW